MSSYIPNQIDLTPRRHHGYAVLLFIMGTLLPPLAVAARFGIGRDFWINILLTLCGYIPGHGHNFYIQNIRNNKTHARTPKWAQRYGLVDTSEIRRKERKSQWASRYNDRLPRSTLEGQPLEEGQEQGSSLSLSSDNHEGNSQRDGNNGLWRPEDERYYSNQSSSGRWRYPANFDDAVVSSSGSRRGKKKKEKKDRWARTEDAYNASEQSSRRKSKRKKSKSSLSVNSRQDSTEFPEDPEGGLYGDRQKPEKSPAKKTTTDDVFNHEF